MKEGRNGRKEEEEGQRRGTGREEVGKKEKGVTDGRKEGGNQ